MSCFCGTEDRLTTVTPQNVMLTQNAITLTTDVERIKAKCNKFLSQKVKTFLTLNVITQNVISLKCHV